MKPAFFALWIMAASSGCALTTDEIGRALFVTSDASLSGEAIFQQVIDTGHTSVQVTLASAAGAVGRRAVFVLDGTCPGEDSDVDGAAPHWNPDGAAHGRHRGDLGTVELDETGAGVLRVTSHRQFIVSEGGADDDVVGRGVAVHAQADDGVTEPDGGAGDLVACANVALSD